MSQKPEWHELVDWHEWGGKSIGYVERGVFAIRTERGESFDYEKIGDEQAVIERTEQQEHADYYVEELRIIAENESGFEALCIELVEREDRERERAQSEKMHRFSEEKGISWELLADESNDDVPGLADSWETYFGKSRDGVYYIRHKGYDGDDCFDIGSAKDFVDWVKERRDIEMYELWEIVEYSDEFKDVRDLVAPLFEDDEEEDED